MGLFEKHFDELKKVHKELQVTAYVPTYYKEFGTKKENNIRDNKDFYRFWKKRKDWLKIALHGYSHRKPPEYLRSKYHQVLSLNNSFKVLSPYLEPFFGFKAPFYRINNLTPNILDLIGVSWYCQWWSFIPLRVIKRQIPHYVVLGTHCGTKEQNNPDNIDKIYDQLDFHLHGLESKGFKFSNFNEIMRGAIQ